MEEEPDKSFQKKKKNSELLGRKKKSDLKEIFWFDIICFSNGFLWDYNPHP